MPLLLLLLIGVVIFLVIKYIAVITAVTAIVVSGITVVALVSTWLGTSAALQKSDYRSCNAKQTCHQVESDLNQIAADLTEMRLQLDDVGPYLRDMEFLRYARQNRKVDN